MNTKKLPTAAKVSAALISLCCLSSLSLTGCGGGGATGAGTSAIQPPQPPFASASPTVPPTVPPTAMDDHALQLSAPPPVYQDTALLSAYAAIDAARRALGVGVLNQSTGADAAAQAHANYIIARFAEGDFFAANHTENPAKSGYTGTNAGDRVRFAGVAAVEVGENLSSIVQVDGATDNEPGARSVAALLTAPYHRALFFDSLTSIGIGHASARLKGEGGVNNILVYNLIVPQGKSRQLPAPTWVGVWPVDGATDTPYEFGTEEPNPIPVNQGRCGGYPISVYVRTGQVLTTKSLTLQETVSGATVPMQVSTKGNDANPAFAQANSMYGIPFRPLKLATTYTVHFTGDNNGMAIDKTWRFTTVSRNLKALVGCDPS